MRRRAALVFTVALLAGDAAAQTVRLRGDPWCPYNCEPESDHPGFAVELARASLSAVDVTVQYATMPFTRALAEAHAGRIEGVIIADPDAEESAGLVFPIEGFGRARDVMIVRSDSPFRYEGVDSLGNLSIGVVLGYAYNDPIDSYIRANRSNPMRVQWAGGDAPFQMNLRKLIARRIDATIETEFVVAWELKRAGLANRLRIVDFGTQGNRIKLGFTPVNQRSAVWAAAFDAGVRKMRANGELEKILARYGVRDWGTPEAPVSQ